MSQLAAAHIEAEKLEPADVSIVVPTVGRLPLLRECLTSLLSCRPAAAEIVVVDQSHGDGVRRLIDELAAPSLRRVEDRGRGIARALNMGIAAALQPVILVTHDDCAVRHDWVAVAVRVLDGRPSLLVSGRVEPAVASAHVPSCKTDTMAEDHRTGLRFDLLYCNNWAAMRDKVLSLGGFDERTGLRLAAEDCDFCYRWTSDARPIRYEPDLVVWHKDWRSELDLRRTYRAYGRGLGAFYAKHLLAGQRPILSFLKQDLVRGARHSWRGRREGSPAGFDHNRGLLLGLPVGLAFGALEEMWLRIRRLRHRRG